MARLLSMFALLATLSALPSAQTSESGEPQEGLETTATSGRIAQAGTEQLEQSLSQAETRINHLQEVLAEKQRAIEALKTQLRETEATLESQATRQSTSASSTSRPNASALELIVSTFIVLTVVTPFVVLFLRRRRHIVAPELGLDESQAFSTKATESRSPFARQRRPRFSTALALLYIPTGLVRGMMISLMPLQALELLGTAQKVSVMYLFVGIGGVAMVLMIPKMSRRFGSRRVFEFGVLCAVVSMTLLPVVSTVTFFIGMILHVLAVASFEIAMMLFLMTSLKREEYKFFEPYRVICAASGFLVGPVLSIYLRDHVWYGLPFALTALFAVLGWLYMRYLGVGEIGRSTTTLAANPFAYIHRFFSQPRLALAYTISIGRYAWWVMFYIYVPIYGASTELGALAGGLLVSVGTAATWLAPVWGRLGRYIGLRNLFVMSVFGTGTLTLLASATAGLPQVCAIVLLAAAVAASISDGASHLPFYRATRQRERTEMSGVYATHRDVGQLLPPTIFAFVLKFLPLPVVFVTGGLVMLGLTPLCRFLPRRM